MGRSAEDMAEQAEGSSVAVAAALEVVWASVFSPFRWKPLVQGPTSSPCRHAQSYEKLDVGKDCDGRYFANPESGHAV